jgi:hypothetical protein
MTGMAMNSAPPFSAIRVDLSDMLAEVVHMENSEPEFHTMLLPHP